MEEAEANPAAEVPPAEGSGGQDDPNKACTSCQAKKTPMWRNGPDGPKTLCNACGVRLYRQTNKESKEKRAALEAGALPESEERAALHELFRRLREATSREAIDAVMREEVIEQLDADERAELDRRMDEALQGVNLPLGQRRGRRDRKQPQRTSSSQDQDGEGRSVRARRDKSASTLPRRREDPGGWADTPRTMMGSMGMGIGRPHDSASPDGYDPPVNILSMYPFDIKEHGQPTVPAPRQQYYGIPGFVPSAAPQTSFHLLQQPPLPTACESGYPEDHNGALAGLGHLGGFPQDIGELDHYYNSGVEGRFSAANSDDFDSLLPDFPLEQLGGNGTAASPCFGADAAAQPQGHFGQLENGMTTPFRSLNNVKVHAAVSPAGTPTFTPSNYSSPEYERRVANAQPRGNSAPLWGSQCGSAGGALPLLTSSQHHDQMYLSIRQLGHAAGTPAFRPDSMTGNNLDDMAAQCRDDPCTGQSTFGHVAQEVRRRNKPARGQSQRNNMPEMPRSRAKQSQGSGSDISTMLNTLSAEVGGRRTEAARINTPHNFEMVDEQIKQSKNIQLGIATNWAAPELHLPQAPNTGRVLPLGMSQPEDTHKGGHMDSLGGYMNYPTHPPSNMAWFSTPYLQPDLAGLMQNSMLPTFPTSLPLSIGEHLANEPEVPNNFLPSLSHAPWQGMTGMSGSSSTPSRVDLPDDEDDVLDAVLSSLGP